MDEVRTDNQTDAGKYQVLIVNIKWSKTPTSNYSSKHKEAELPDTFTLDLPESVLNQAKKKHNVFNDVIESFVYNFLTRKFGYEVSFCQTYLPLEDTVAA